MIHLGHEPSRGHYVSLVNSHGHWLLFDDEDVEAVPEQRLMDFFGLTDEQLRHSKVRISLHGQHPDSQQVSQSAYILFYQARDSVPEQRSSRRKEKADKDKQANGANHST